MANGYLQPPKTKSPATNAVSLPETRCLHTITIWSTPAASYFTVFYVLRNLEISLIPMHYLFIPKFNFFENLKQYAIIGEERFNLDGFRDIASDRNYRGNTA